MAATISQDWQTVINSEPTGSLTIGTGSNRMFVLITTAETDGDYTISVMTVGGESATYTFDVFWESGGTNDLKVTAHVWNEAAIAAMSGSTASYTDDTTDAKKHFNYITMQDTAQQSPPDDSPSVSSSTTHDVDTTSTSDDWILWISAGQSAARPITDADTTDIFWNDGTDSYMSSGGDGVGGDNTTTLTIGLADELLALGLVFEAVPGNLMAKMMNEGHING
jgi:hypothetical protein